MPQTPTLPGQALPVDAVLPRLVSALQAHGAAVLVAPPGAGKTTRVPLALLDDVRRSETSGALAGRIVLLEPRRIAARAAARRLAETLGERVGETVGLRVRGETRVGRATRIEVVTEGVLTRLLLADPEAAGVGTVVFDEFHERSLDADLGLALALHARALLRPDLRIVVMSATLDGARVAAMIGPDTPVVESHGRAFPVDVRHGRAPAARRARDTAEAVAGAVQDSLRDEPGSVLAFLPGTAEIRLAAERLAGAVPPDVDLAPLYGDLSAEAQDAAIRPAASGRRKVVLATSIAETSLTIDGVRVVVDSGLARRPRHDAASGMSRLETVRVSRAEADQRAGRAGRTAPGVAVRLWSPAEDAALVRFAPPEIAQADLAPLALALAAWGAAPDELAWLDPPPPVAFATARTLLAELDALDAAGRLTPHGQALAAQAMHPRLAHLALRGGQTGVCADLVALLSDRDPVRPDGPAPVDADLRLRLEALRGERPHVPGGRVDTNALRAVRMEAERWRRAWNTRDAGDPDDAGRLVALAYPDRVAQRVGEGAAGARYRMRDGRTALLDRTQPLADAPFLALAALDDRPGGARVFLAAPLTESEIEAAFADQIVTDDTVAWDGTAVRARRTVRLGAVVLRETPLRNADPAAVAEAFLGGLRAAGVAALPWSRDAARLRERLAFLHHHAPEAWPDVSDAALLGTLGDWLGPYLTGMSRLADVARVDLAGALVTLAGPGRRAEIDRLAPSHVTVPSGSHIALDYADPDAPVLAVRLQETFGLRETPRVLGGRVPVVMHLLSPAGRPAQVTRDLASFWATGYFDVRKDLRGRYPKHAWPDDPTTAEATARGGRRPR
ncbi:MAG TPA: ATP-dependent helicase HrpB [Rubricoccaceae bacterium]|jgi:ATP-dependent helicase HrpB